MKCPEKIIFFDTETTGIAGDDEILSLAIVDQEGKTLFNELIRPSHKTKWSEAEAVNGISPDTVKDKPDFEFFRTQIQQIFDQADLVVGYNVNFDLGFIRNKGIRYSGPVVDVMEEFAPIYGEWSDFFGDYKWQKLTVCAHYYGYDWGKTAAHDALADTLATRYCFYKVWNAKDGNMDIYNV